MQQIAELKREGLSINKVSEVTRFDRKIIRKYLRQPGALPAYGSTREAAQQTGSISGLHRGAAEGWRLECSDAAAGVARARLSGWLHDPEGLLASAAAGGQHDCGPAV